MLIGKIYYIIIIYNSEKKIICNYENKINNKTFINSI